MAFATWSSGVISALGGGGWDAFEVVCDKLLDTVLDVADRVGLIVLAESLVVVDMAVRARLVASDTGDVTGRPLGTS